MDKKQQKNLWVSAAMLILLPLLVFLVFRSHFQEILDQIRAIPAAAVLLLLALGLAYQLLESAASLTLIKSRLPDFSLGQALEVTFLGVFANVATFAVGAIPLQSWYLYRCGLTAGSGASMMTLEYTIHKAAILLYTTVMLLLQRRWLTGQDAGLSRYMLLGYGVCTLIIIGLLLLCTWGPVQRLARRGIDRLPGRGKWAVRKADWTRNLDALYGQSRCLLHDRRRLCRVLLWDCLKLFCLYLTLFLALRLTRGAALSLWRVQLLGGLMHMISSALPNVAGMGPAEFSFLLVFSHYQAGAQLPATLILYRTATYFFPFAVSIFVFLAVQRRAAKGKLVMWT